MLNNNTERKQKNDNLVSYSFTSLITIHYIVGLYEQILSISRHYKITSTFYAVNNIKTN